MRRCLVLAVLVSICPLAFAQAYKWKDAQGVTHYADAPPSGKVRYEKIKTTGTAEAPAPAPAAAPASTAANAASTTTTVTSDTPENRAKLCDALRKNADILTNQGVVTMDDGKGGRKQVDEPTRQLELKKTQAQMTLYCQS